MLLCCPGYVCAGLHFDSMPRGCTQRPSTTVEDDDLLDATDFREQCVLTQLALPAPAAQQWFVLPSVGSWSASVPPAMPPLLQVPQLAWLQGEVWWDALVFFVDWTG